MVKPDLARSTGKQIFLPRTPEHEDCVDHSSFLRKRVLWVKWGSDHSGLLWMLMGNAGQLAKQVVVQGMLWE